ncbi:MAG TPA: sulfate ABC transporter substrate-binding protein [Ilumatobacteraceae bacterium]|nr:sulfate ABC transporter substrate-binding protein [Ilumatobacteraceae bacterium]
MWNPSHSGSLKTTNPIIFRSYLVTPSTSSPTPATSPVRRRWRTTAAAVMAVMAGVGVMACGSSDAKGDGGGTSSTNLNLVGFAVPKAANNAMQAAFAKTPAGAGVTWTESYGASGEQSRAVVAGLKADYVHFSLEGDVTRLVDSGQVAADWNAGPTQGIVSDSVVVLVVRPDNPKGITGWADLIRDDIGIVTPNPGSSGAARWNILAAYGQVLANGGTEQQAADYLTAFFEHTVALPGSGRDATTAFLAGTGDVLISYENEAILARQQGEKLEYFVPDATLLIENPGAVLINADPKATAWLEFVLSPAGQTELVKKGFRPVIDGVAIGGADGITVDGANDPTNPFPTPSQLFTIADRFGGWKATNKAFFDADTGIVTLIQQKTGKQ